MFWSVLDAIPHALFIFSQTARSTEWGCNEWSKKKGLKDATLPEIAEGILKVREGRVKIEPGYDGEYGKIKIFREGEQKTSIAQQHLL